MSGKVKVFRLRNVQTADGEPIDLTAFYNQLGGGFFDFQSVFGTPNTSTFSTPNFNPNVFTPTSGATSSSNSGTSVWQQIANQTQGQLRFDTITGLISQTLAGILPKPNTQIGGLTVQTVQPPNVNNGYGTGGLVPTGYIPPTSQNPNGIGTQAVDTTKGLFDSIASSFNISTTMLFIGLGFGAYLLLKEPPRRR